MQPRHGRADKGEPTRAARATIKDRGDPMFGFLTLCLKLAIYAGALTTVVASAVFGPEITTEPGFPGISLAIAYVVGGVIGIFSTAILFGIPIVLLSINANLERAVVLLKTMRPASNGSGLMESLMTIFVDSKEEMWRMI